MMGGCLTFADWERYKAIAKRIAGIPGWKVGGDTNHRRE
jgi:hypothetical protein